MGRRVLVVVGALFVAAAGGAAYVHLERETERRDERVLVPDASADARAGRGKNAGRKRSPRSAGKPRGSGAPAAQGGAGLGGAVDEGDDGEGAGGVASRPFTGRGPAGPTYEAAIASNVEEIAIGAQGGRDIDDAQLSRPMQNGAFVGECGAPEAMKVTVKVAIRAGRAAGVSVTTSPADPDVAGCIDRYVRTFAWPSSPKKDSFTTTY